MDKKKCRVAYMIGQKAQSLPFDEDWALENH